MRDEDWQLDESLDALNDLLYGGYGALQGLGPVRIIWRAMDKSAADLGFKETRRWLAAKLERPEIFDSAAIKSQIALLEAGQGKSYFDLTRDIFADPPSITLVPG